MFRGSFVALVTPLTASDEIDWPAFDELIEWQIAEGTDGLVLAGSTGEGATLTPEEKRLLFKRGVEIAKGRIPIIASTGTSSTRLTTFLTEEALQAGADGALVVVPYYNRPVAAGCLAHYSAVAQTGLPLILYHHPGRTGVRLSLDCLLELAAIPGIVAIKEASGDLVLATELARRLEIPLLSGDDSLALPHLSVGFQGVISVVGNLIPCEWASFVRNPTKERFFTLYDLCRCLVIENNPQEVKYALSLLGKCQPHLRLPLLLPESSIRERIEQAVQAFSLIS